MQRTNFERSFLLVPFMFLALCAVALAQGKGEAGIVLRDDAPVYVHSKGAKVEATLKRGDAVAGITTEGVLGQHYEFEEEDGRIHIFYFRPPKTEGTGRTAWMDPADIAKFLYDCGCDKETESECRPYRSEFLTGKWNACFKEARDAKLAILRPQWEGTVAVPQTPSSTNAEVAPGTKPATVERPLTNEDVVSLVKLDLGDEIVITKIQQAPTEELDVSTEALIALKGQGVGKSVLDAMIKRAAQRKP